MNSESLYEQFKWKQLQQRHVQEHELNRIQSLCNQPKINLNSACILLKRTIEILDQFPDELLINLQTSIPILQSVSILQVLNSITQAKAKLLQGNNAGQQSRLRNQTQFIYYLWNMIDQEQIQCREIKQLIGLLQSKKKNELKFILTQIYPDQNKVQQFLKAWICLTANQQYYRYVGKNNYSSNQNNKQNNCQQQHFSSHLLKNDKSGQLGSPIYEKNKSGNKILVGVASDGQQMGYPSQFGYTYHLSANQQKELVQRLYRNDIYRQREQQKRQKQLKQQELELKQCTFKPNLMKRGMSASSKTHHSQIKGYDKAINRIKAGNQKNKVSKQMRDYKPIGQNYDKIKQKGINPPKFLERKKKQEEKVLFIISFDLGRHKTNVKIRQNDNQDSVAQKICKIYSLKKEFYDEIREIVKSQLDAYYEQMQQIKQQ